MGCWIIAVSIAGTICWMICPTVPCLLLFATLFLLRYMIPRECGHELHQGRHMYLPYLSSVSDRVKIMQMISCTTPTNSRHSPIP